MVKHVPSPSQLDTVVVDGSSLPDAKCAVRKHDAFHARKTHLLTNGLTTLVTKPFPHGISDQLEVNKHGRKANVYEVHH